MTQNTRACMIRHHFGLYSIFNSFKRRILKISFYYYPHKMYPLGPLPSELIEKIICEERNPQLYASLSRTSKKLYQVAHRTLPIICRSKISPREIINYMTGSNSEIYLTYFHDPDSDREVFARVILRPNIKDKKLINIDLNTLGSAVQGTKYNELYRPEEIPGLLQLLSRRGFTWLKLDTIYKIVSRRQSCIKLDPAYALNYVWNVFQLRLQEIRQVGSLPYGNYQLGGPETNSKISFGIFEPRFQFILIFLVPRSQLLPKS